MTSSADNLVRFRRRRRPTVRFDLSPAAYRVLFFMTSRQKSGEPGVAITGTQTEMARVLGNSQPTISKALRELREAGVIRPIVSGVWNIHADYMFGGFKPVDNVVSLPFVA
ncbi:helix-turn-helix domain-containing protein [Streptomyces sp. NPDC057011]|uniref:helix-turn-helix domain-containing protein n=1 Tax=unclassified Streptomyces TaxID=2593676 RepID=UPI00363BE988